MEECRWDVFIEEILSRLSTKNLQTFQTVCQNWYRIIRSPYFVKLHLNVYNQSRIRILRVNNLGVDMMTAYNYTINSDEGETKQISIPVICGRRFKILGSCDGLLCLILGTCDGLLGLFPGEGCKIVVYNPSTGKYFSVQLCPPLNSNDYGINCSWFGRNPSSGEYILVLGIVWFESLHSEVGIYKFTRSNLELIQSASCCILPQIYKFSRSDLELERGTLLHGALHWSGCRRNGCRYIICAYHLDDKRYYEISPPVQRDFKLGVAQGCLMAIFKGHVFIDMEFELWIMKEYGNEQSWIKYADIPGIKFSKDLTLLGYFPNGDLILDVNKHQLIKYTFDDNKEIPLKDHEYDGRFFNEAIMCADSLVAPTIVVGGGVVA